MTAALLGSVSIDLLRRALDGFTVDAVQELLGPVGRAALDRGDLAGAERVLPADDPVSTLVRLFLLGQPIEESAVRSALRPLDLTAPALLERSGGRMRARFEIRPHASERSHWWVVSDFGSDVRPGPLAADHVLGVGAAALTLAQAVPRRPVGRALDVGTGSGVQALYLADDAATVVATDISERALRFAATTAALSGLQFDLRQGSLLAPARGERFDTVVSNPPFVVSPGLDRDTGGFDYRDSGWAGDEMSAALVRELPALLAPGGTASLLANWIVPADGDWAARVGDWVARPGCDAWVWQRDVVEPGAYVALWLRDAGEVPGSPRWTQRYDAWLHWFEASGIAAVGMGLITLWHSDRAEPSVVCEDVPQPVEQPAGLHIAGWVARQRWLRDHDDANLLRARLRCADGVVRTRQDVLGNAGWRTERATLRQSHGMRWEVETDDAIAGLVAACDATTPLELPIRILAATSGQAVDAVTAAVVPVVRDLIGRGFLEIAP